MIVELKEVSKILKRQVILDKVSIKLTPGRITGIIGRNGSGKTVLLKIMCGIFEPDEGSIFFDNEETIKKVGIPKNTRALIESPEMIGELSGFENLKLIASIQNTISDNDIYKSLELVGLKGEEDKKYRDYSLGMKQKLGIAQVIMEDAELLILDEPFNGLDEKSVVEMRNLFKELKNKNKIIVIATHIKEDIEEFIDDLYRIDNGKLIYEAKNKK